MRFDDSLKTVLAAEASSALGARAAFRQLVDLIGRGRAPASTELMRRLDDLRRGVPVAVRLACARGLALADAPSALIAFFAADEPDVAAAALRAARLDPEAWETLLPRLGPRGRSVLRRRRDLAPSVTRALESFGATDFALEDRTVPAVDKPRVVSAVPATERFEIADLVGRIEAFQRERGTADVMMETPPVAAFRFETDAAGVIRWVDSGPRGAVIGLTLDHHASGAGAASVDGIAAGAFRKRGAFVDARLIVPGGSAIAGDWRISGVPMFDQASGSFVGVRGHARRPRIEEVAARSGERVAGAEGLRRLVHELRTPTNAIAGFSELIEQELLGPIPPTYRERASDIRRHVTGLIGAIEDLDLAARIDGDALELRPATVAVFPLLARVAHELSALAALRGSRVELPQAGEASWSADPQNVERLVSRLLATLLSATRPGEVLRMALVHGVEALALTVSVPVAFVGKDEPALLALDDEDALADDGAPLLGVGFALRLVRNLAVELGGRFVVAADGFTLLLPGAAGDVAGQASTSVP